MTTELGRLKRVDLRDIWETEAQHFTPWLAEPDNLAVLSDTLKMELELEAQEKHVGPFRADILCKNLDDNDSWVLIENQLEKTDHNHLGQLLTYAAGLQAVTIIWIAHRFTEEHRASLDWLNDITDDKFRFFGLEVELWKIGNSQAAPKFNIISKPNDWTRSVSKAAKQISEYEVTETKLKQQNFWALLKAELEEKNSPVRMHKPLPQSWMNCGIGRSGFNLVPTLNSRDNRIAVEIYLYDDNAKKYFNLLKEDRAAIENQIGQGLEWKELPERKSSRIVLIKNETNPLEESLWEQNVDWFIEKLELFNLVFRKRIKTLKVETDQPGDIEVEPES